jgi:hypothetical protein
MEQKKKKKKKQKEQGIRMIEKLLLKYWNDFPNKL